MLSLLYDSQNNLSKTSIQTIFELLKVSSPPDITNFLNDFENEEIYFYDFFFGVLRENDIPLAIDDDWRWSPENLFWQLERYFAQDTLKLIRSDWIELDSYYRIEYSFNGTREVVEVSLDDPNRLFDSLSRHVKNCQFIALNFFEDRYSWLIVPKDFNTKLFCTLTGFTVEKPAPTQKIPKNFAEGYKQSEKLFFSPTIIYVDEKQTQYAMPGQVWAGRVLPGQTIKEGIATELKTELNYSDRFDYTYDGLEGTSKDRKGRDIKKYRLTVYLFDKTFQSKLAGGADIRLRKMPGKTFSHPSSTD